MANNFIGYDTCFNIANWIFLGHDDIVSKSSRREGPFSKRRSPFGWHSLCPCMEALHGQTPHYGQIRAAIRKGSWHPSLRATPRPLGSPRNHRGQPCQPVIRSPSGCPSPSTSASTLSLLPHMFEPRPPLICFHDLEYRLLYFGTDDNRDIGHKKFLL